MFFVSIDSKQLRFPVSRLFSALTSKSTSVDSKGLALREDLRNLRFLGSRIQNELASRHPATYPKKKSGSQAAARQQS